MKRLAAYTLVCLSMMLLPAVASAAPAQPPAEMLHAAYTALDADASMNAQLFKTVLAPDATIVDEFAPYEWSGPGSVDRYITTLKTWVAANGLTHLQGSAEEPRFWDVSGDSAWLVLPAVFTYELAGTPSVESGVYTFVFTRTGGHWRVRTFAWATTGQTRSR